MVNVSDIRAIPPEIFPNLKTMQCYFSLLFTCLAAISLYKDQFKLTKKQTIHWKLNYTITKEGISDTSFIIQRSLFLAFCPISFFPPHALLPLVTQNPIILFSHFLSLTLFYAAKNKRKNNFILRIYSKVGISLASLHSELSSCSGFSHPSTSERYSVLLTSTYTKHLQQGI